MVVVVIAGVELYPVDGAGEVAVLRRVVVADRCTGVGAEVIRPMAAPVLGGLLIADEVIDIFLPVLYFAVKKWQWRKIHGLGAFEDRVRAGSARANGEVMVS